MTTLHLKRVGCDFWETSEEKKVSDLTNFRVVAELEYQGVKYVVEFLTHDYADGAIHPNGKKGVWTLVDSCCLVNGFWHSDNEMDYLKKNMLEGRLWIKPTQKEVLKVMNKRFGTDYTEIEFEG